MAHYQQQDFCNSVKTFYPKHFNNVHVLDIGSLDINGNNRYLFNDYTYIGLDIAEGTNVDIVCKAHEYEGADSSFDFVISTECFEHDPFYKKTVMNAIRLLKSGGMFLFTCATDPRLEHGTEFSDNFWSAPLSKDFPEFRNYYKNLHEKDFTSIKSFKSSFESYTFEKNTDIGDLYFYGIKK
jgi:SAM-dependent methyltransferase